MTNDVPSSQAQISPEAFRRTIDGDQVDLYLLKNSNGLEANITNYGGIVVSLKVPDKNGELGDTVLGYDNLNDYLGNNPYFGALIGRYGNRIASGRFIIDGVEYQLAQNDGLNALHGGRKGFDKVVWQAAQLDTPDGPALQLTHTSKDGEQNYPGTLRCTVTYTLTHQNELKIEYAAEADKPTFVNLTITPTSI
jgi:aldose 1-epimerase